MIVSINPTYLCNFRCDFCYLTSEQLADKKKVDLRVLDERLSEIPDIHHIDLYGGEISTLGDDYFYDMKKIIRKHYDGVINIVTNYASPKTYMHDNDISLSVSYDFAARERSDIVFANMLVSPVPISVLILASRNVLDMDVPSMVQELSLLSNLRSVEIKPYSTNQANCHNVKHSDYEEFVKKWLELDLPFEFENLYRIEESISGNYNAFSNNHVYITPSGKFGVLEFDVSDREYFLELDSFDEYRKWALIEPIKNVSDICRNCDYFGRCLTEHYRYVHDLTDGCNGHRELLEWTEKRY